MVSVNTDTKIESLQVLRAIAFLGIFLSHAGAPFSWSNLSVSTFFVLSGFLLAYRHQDLNEKYNVLQRIDFSYRKIRKLYGLHITTMALTLIPLAVFRIEKAAPLFLKTILNLLLLQTWIPVIAINVSLNGVAWFLSVMAFQYFCFPGIAHWLKNIYSTKKLAAISIMIWVFMLSISLCFIEVYEIDGNFFKYFTKFCPLFRMGDFSIGCIWGRIIKLSETGISRSNLHKRKASIGECAIFIAVAGIVVLGKQTHTSTIAKWIWNPTSMWLLCSVLLVVLFFLKKGMITEWLTKRKSLVSLGNISGELFLIHYVVLFYFQSILNRLLENHVLSNAFFKITVGIMELAVTVLCSLLWNVCIKQFRSIRKRDNAR